MTLFKKILTKIKTFVFGEEYKGYYYKGEGTYIFCVKDSRKPEHIGMMHIKINSIEEFKDIINRNKRLISEIFKE